MGRTDVSGNQIKSIHDYHVVDETKRCEGTSQIHSALEIINAATAAEEAQDLEHCPLEYEEIREKSLLDRQSASSFPNLSQLDPDRRSCGEKEVDGFIRMACNFLGGGLVTGAKADPVRGGDVDGFTPLANFLTWDWVVDQLQKDPFYRHSNVREIVDKLKAGTQTFISDSAACIKIGQVAEGVYRHDREEALSERATAVTSSIQRLPKGHSYAIYGGWSNRDGGTGHAIIYEFTRTGRDTFDIALLTSTGYSLTDALIVGDKKRLKPVVLYKNVPESEIFFNDDGVVRPAFIQSLLELKVLSRWDNQFIVDEEDILEIFDHVEKYRHPVALDEYGAITGQHGGTCVPSSTKQWIRKQCKNKAMYKVVMFKSKLILTAMAYQTLKDEIEGDHSRGKMSRTLLSQLARNMLRAVKKVSQIEDAANQPISDDEMAAAVATGYDILNRVKVSEERILAEKKKQGLPCDLHSSNFEKQREERRDLNLGTRNRYIDARYLKESLPDLEALRIENFGPEKVSDFLDAALAATKGHRVDDNMILNAVVDQLPMPQLPEGKKNHKVDGTYWVEQVSSPFWDSIAVEELPVVLDKLHRFAGYYMKHFDTKTVTRTHATILPLQALIHYLSLKIDREKNWDLDEKKVARSRLENYKVPYRGFEANRLKSLIYFDGQEYERIESANAYFRAFNSQARYQEIFSTEDNSEVVKDSVHKALGNGQFWRGLLHHEAVSEAVKTVGDRKWPDLTEEEINEDLAMQKRIYERLSKENEGKRNEREQWLKERGHSEESYCKYLEEVCIFGGNYLGVNDASPGKPTPLKPLELWQPKNLPKVQKQIMALESSKIWKEELKDYRYIWCMREMTHWANQVIRKNTHPDPDGLESTSCRCGKDGSRPSCSFYDDSSERPGAYKKYSTDSKIYKSGSVKDMVVNNIDDTISESYRNVRDVDLQNFLKKGALSRDEGRWKKEIAEAWALKKVKDNSFLEKILRSATEWRLTPHQLVMELKKNLEETQNVDFQEAFFRYFLRSPVTQKGNAKLGVGQLIVEDKALFEECKALISMGVEHFKNSRNDNSIDGGRFFLELASYLGGYLKDAGQVDKAKQLFNADIIDRWLDKEELKESQKSVLHYYRVLIFSNRDPKTLSEEEVQKVLQSWAYCGLYPENSGKWVSKVLDRKAKAFMTRLAAAQQGKIEADQDFRNTLCQGILRAAQVHLPQGEVQWKVMSGSYESYPLLICNLENSRFYKINLRTGKIYTQHGSLCSMGREKTWHSDRDFLRIFKGRKDFEYRSEGNGIVTFTDPEFGNVRLILEHYGSDRGVSIQRQFPGSNRWFEYKGRDYLSVIPQSLCDDHTFWVPVDKFQCKYKGYIASLETQQRLYALDNEGCIVQVDSVTGEEIEGGRVVDAMVHSPDTRGVMSFDREVLLFRDKSNAIKEVLFPRYTSVRGNPLQFQEQWGEFVWNDNKQYRLSFSRPEGVLGTIPNYLYLQSTTGSLSDKILVPFQEGDIDAVPYASASLKIENRVAHYRADDKKDREQCGIHTYFVYNIEGDDIVPTTQEGTLFLSYLMMSQKRYGEAITLLHSLKSSQALSPMSRKILEMITLIKTSEDDPNSRVGKLHAQILLMKDSDNTSSDEVTNYFESSHQSLNRIVILLASSEKYLQGLNNVDIGNRLSKEDEAYFFTRLYSAYRSNKSEIIRRKIFTNMDLIEVAAQQMKHRIERLLTKVASDTVEVVSRGVRRFPDNEENRHRYEASDSETLFYEPHEPVRYWEKPNHDNRRKWDGVYSYRLGRDMHTLEDALRDYEQQESVYDEALHRYNREVREQTAWLVRYDHSKPLTKLCTRMPTNFSVIKNGPFFLETVDIALHGSESQRQERLFILKQWRMHSSWTGNHLSYLDRMICMLLFPEEFRKEVPSLGEAMSGPESKMKFLKKVDHFYESHSTLSKLWKFIKGEKFYHHLACNDLGESDYPTPSESFYDQNMKLSLEEEKPKVAFAVKNPETQGRWDELKKWSEAYVALEEVNNADHEKDFTFTYDPSLLSKHDERYEATVKRGLFELQQEYNAGKEYNEKLKRPMITGDACRALCEEASKREEALRKELGEEEKSLGRLANARPVEEREKVIALATKGGNSSHDLTYENCVALLLTGDKEAFLKANPHLDYDRAVERVAEKTLKIGELKSHLAQLQRIQELSKKIEGIDHFDDPNRISLSEKLYTELTAKYHFEGFDHDDEVALRIFSGQTGMIPYEKQMNLIKKMLKMSHDDPDCYRDIVIQLIMGGGKTSVLATILLFLGARREGRISMFIVPPSLFDTVKINLGDSLKKAFNCSLEAIDYCRDDLTPYTLKRLLEKLKVVQKYPVPVIIKPTTLQVIELEMLSQSRRFKSLWKMQEQQAERNKVLSQEIEDLREQWWQREANQAKIENEIHIKEKLYKANEERQKNTQESLDEVSGKLKLLADVVHTVSSSADGLIDEVDIILDCLQEVNFPDGQKARVGAARNNLLLSVFQALTSRELKVSTLSDEPTVDTLLHLRKKDRKNFNKEQYLEHVVPVIAKHLADRFEPISKHLGEYRESFIRYAKGAIPSFLETMIDDDVEITAKNLDRYAPEWREMNVSLEALEEDTYFLKYLNDLFNNEDEESVEAAHLIALTRHFLTELTPETLDKYPNKDFGPKGKTSKIIPYLAVHAPARTEFGYHWEEACYYYQYACAYPPTEEVVLDLGLKLEDMAQYFVEKNGEAYDETCEYEVCRRLFGVELNKIKDPAVLNQAVAHISADLDKCLEMQFENVARNVAFTPERLSNDGIALQYLLSSRRAMSGTPWNVDGYVKSLSSRYKNDLGVEGRILYTLAQREEEGKIHEGDLSTIETFLDGIYSKHETPRRIRGIIEAGGIFNAFSSNYDVAKGIAHYLEAHPEYVDDKMEGVLFFHKDPGQEQSDTLYVWKLGMPKPERVGGSSVQALKAKGMNPENYFTYYDERHTTGTDIVQVPEAINLFTFSNKMLRRTVGQGIMRERLFLISQDVEIVMTSEIRKMLFNSGKSMNDCMISAEKQQSFRKAHDMVQYFQKHINNIFRWISRRKIQEAVRSGKSYEDIVAYVERLEPFFVTYMYDEPYLQFGRLKTKSNTKAYLDKYLERKLKRFEKACGKAIGPLAEDVDALNEAKALAEEMKTHIAEAKCLPEEWEDVPESMNVQQEINEQQQVEVNQQVEVEVEIEMEIDLELQRYEALCPKKFKKEEKLSFDEFTQMLEAMKSGDPRTNAKITSLQEQLSCFDYGYDRKKMPYEKVFSEPIYGTDAFFNSSNMLLPVFHKLQRPAKQILAVRLDEEHVHWLLVSERQAKFVKRYLQAMCENEDPRAEGVWFIQPDASQIVDSEHAEPFPLKGLNEDDALRLEEGLLEINAFIGNIDYLNKHTANTEDWLKVDPNGLKVRFLKLKVARDAKQNEILRRSVVIAAADKENKHDAGQYLVQERIDKEKKRQGNYHPESEVAAKVVGPKLVKDLNVKWVPFLGIDVDADDPLTVKALEVLEKGISNSDYPRGSEERKRKLKNVALERSKRQFLSLRDYHGCALTVDQVKWFKGDLLDCIKLLKSKEQICHFEGDTIKEYALEREQALALTKEQAHLIPFVNPKYIDGFTKPWQVAKVPLEYIDRINAKALHLLSKEQLKGVSKEQFQSLIGKIPPKNFIYFHGNLLEKIVKAGYGHLTHKDQIAEISDPELIPQLEALAKSVEQEGFEYEKGFWTSCISGKMVKYIDFDTQLPFLNKRSQIRELPSERVKGLKVEQIDLISKDQVQYLEGEEQIQHCPNALVKYLTSDQLNFLKPEQIRYLGREQVQKINKKETFAHLSAEDHRDEGYFNQMQWILPDQYDFLAEKHVKGLSKEQILQIGYTGLIEEHRLADQWKELRKGLTPHQIRSFDTQELVDLLEPEQIFAHLKKDQVRFLQEEWQVRHCPDALVKELAPWQVAKINERQVPFLEGQEQIQEVVNDFVPLLSPVNQVRHISDAQVASVIDTQVRALKNAHLLIMDESLRRHITEEQIRTFDSQELIDLLDGDQINAFISEEQLCYLKEDWQVRHCPDALVKKLAPWQVAKINERQVPFLEGEEQIQAVVDDFFPLLSPESQVWFISDAQVALVIDTQVRALKNAHLLIMDESLRKHITEEQIRTFDSQELIDLLDGDQINAFISEWQLPFLKKDWQVHHCPDALVRRLASWQVPFLEGEEQIQEVVNDFVPLLSPENQVRHISDAQVASVIATQVRALKNAHLLIMDESLRKHITEEQIRTFDSQELIDLLDGDQINAFISEEQLCYLKKDWQVHHCPDALVRKLAPWQVTKINQRQVAQLEGKKQVQACRNDMIPHLVKKQFGHLTGAMYHHLTQKQIAQFDTQSRLFEEITTKQFNEIKLLDTIRKVPDHLIPKLIYSQFSQLRNTHRDVDMAKRLTDKQVSQLQVKDRNLIGNISPNCVNALNDLSLKVLPERRDMLRHVDSNRLHHLTVRQVRVRNLSRGVQKFGHVMKGIAKSLLMPLVFVADLIVNLARTLFAMFRALFIPTALNGKRIVRELKRTFMARPALDVMGPLELFCPATYLKVRSKLTAAAAA